MTSEEMIKEYNEYYKAPRSVVLKSAERMYKKRMFRWYVLPIFPLSLLLLRKVLKNEIIRN